MARCFIFATNFFLANPVFGNILALHLAVLLWLVAGTVMAHVEVQTYKPDHALALRVTLAHGWVAGTIAV